MSEKTAKRAKPKAAGAKDDAGVLGNLPATRANRFGRTRQTAAAVEIGDARSMAGVDELIAILVANADDGAVDGELPRGAPSRCR